MEMPRTRILQEVVLQVSGLHTFFRGLLPNTRDSAVMFGLMKTIMYVSGSATGCQQTKEYLKAIRRHTQVPVGCPGMIWIVECGDMGTRL